MLNLAPARTPRHRWLAALALITITLTAGAGAARAQQSDCKVGALLGGMEMSVNFGLYNGTENNAMSPSTLTINCKTGSQATRIYVCVGLGAGSAGSTVANRRMQNTTGANLAYQLYSDAARTKVFETLSFSTPTSQQYSTILPAMSAGDRNTGIRIYGRIPAQTITEAGTYISTFSEANFEVRWHQVPSNVAAVVNCKNFDLMPPGNTAAQVGAQVEATCKLGVTQHVNFGDAVSVPPGGVLPSQPAKGTVRVRCAPKASYRIEMNDGLYPQNAGATNASRYMRHDTDTSETLSYELFKPNAAGGNSSQRWGLIANNQHLTATGSNNEYIVHARTADNAIVSAGTYRDRVVVTLHY